MKVVAALACRVQSKRLYAKPLQFLDIDNEITILEYLVSSLKRVNKIDSIVLAISEGEDNIAFHRMAKKMRVPYIIGSEEDVQGRLIAAADHGKGDIIFRITTENPFVYLDDFDAILKRHISEKASLTVVEGLPEGTYYELIDLKDLKRAHSAGERRHRSELCTLYMAERPEEFKLLKLQNENSDLRRPDVRLTVDYPEDLIVVREVYKALHKPGEFIKVGDIIKFLDDHKELKHLNDWIDAGTGRIWK
jgi:spore coat polysaccharide biosynthesis protein SpsF